MASEQGFSWRRSLAWAVTLALHVAALVAMTLPIASVEPPIVAAVERGPWWVPVDVVLPVLASDTAPMPARAAAAPSAPSEAAPVPPRDTAAPRRRDEQNAEGELAPRRAAAASTEASSSASDRPAAPTARPISYVDDDARALLPQENLYAAAPPPREGDYYTPGNGTEDDVFYRPRALDPDPSRFAYAWRPRGNLLDDWLGRLVEKATGKVSIPLNAKFSLVCGTVAGIAGGCTIVRNGGTGVIVERPPPAPWERSNRVQCRELRIALENAEEAAQVAYLIDRLSALCSAPDDEAQNDEARRGAGLRESAPASMETGAPDVSTDQRAL